MGVERHNPAHRGDPHPTALASLREAKAVDLPLPGEVKRMPARRALVIGGSLGGLLAAHLLRREGWDVTVFERNADDLTGRGAGISTHPQLLDILARVGINSTNPWGSGSSHSSASIRADTFILEERTARTMSSWGRLYRSLRDPLPPESYRLGMPLTRVEQDAAGVTAVFDNGARAQGDLLVGADGMRSTVASSFVRCPAALCRLRCLARHARRERSPTRHQDRDFRALYLLPAGGRAVPRLPSPRPQ